MFFRTTDKPQPDCDARSGRRIRSGRVAAATAAVAVALVSSLTYTESAASAVPAGAATTTVAVPTTAMKWKQLSVGWYFACGLTTSSAVYCWGDNARGQLGNGTTTASNIPVPVAGLGSGIASIDAGYEHACAVTDAGGALCWGEGTSGELGNGKSVNSNIPVAVSGLASGVKSISAGAYFTCAVTGSNDGLKCWGDNKFQQLAGLVNGSQSNVPVDAWNLQSGVTGVWAGSGTACATTSDSTYCWGDDSWGQLGLGTNVTPMPIPIRIPAFSPGGTTAQAAGRTLCALVNGGVQCSGQDRSGGNLGAPVTYGVTNTPVAVQGLTSGVANIAVSETTNCALTTAGSVKCWGSNQGGMLGNGDPNNGAGTASGPYNYNPVTPVGLDRNVVSLTAGVNDQCAIMADQSAKCWGLNAQGEMGNGQNRIMVNVPTPVGVTEAPTITTTSIPNAHAGQPYSFQLVATGGQAPYTWAIAAGSLPDGLSLAADTGVISGTTSKSGPAKFTLRVTGADGAIRWSSPTWVDTPMLALQVDPANSATPVITAVKATMQFGYKAIQVNFTYAGTSNRYDVQCASADGNSTSGTSVSSSPATLGWSSRPATCQVRAYSSSLGWSAWSAPSESITP